jgi:uncharacterized protein YlaI
MNQNAAVQVVSTEVYYETYVTKMTEAEARERAKEENVDWENVGSILRQCSCCGAWVDVDEQSGERFIKRLSKTKLDICDDCGDRLELGLETETFKVGDIDPDEYCGGCGHPLDDPYGADECGYCSKCKPHYVDDEDENEEIS